MARDAAGIERPEAVFDREAEWEALAAFVTDQRPGPALGLVTGRRRQGKTYLLQALTRATGAFFFGAHEGTERESLQRLAEAFADHTGSPRVPAWRNWDDAVDALLGSGGERPAPVVVDQFPDLVGQSPTLPSVVHRAFKRARHTPRTRLLLGGDSSLVTNRLFTDHSALRELAGMSITVEPFDFRQAAAFWDIDDPRLATLLHSVVGGTPAHRGFASGEGPTGIEDFDAWMCRTVLNPRTPLHWEATRLLNEEADQHDRPLCHSILRAVALGHVTPWAVTQHVSRPRTDVSHALRLLEDCGLLRGEPDAFHTAALRYRIAEPLLAFDHAVVAPRRSAPEQEDTGGTWERLASDFNGTAVPAAFAQLCRDWALRFASPDTFGAPVATAAHGALPRTENGPEHEAEVVVRGGGSHRPLLSVGQARWNEIMDIHHLDRLRHVLAVLASRGEDISRTKPACYGGAGFSPRLHAAQDRGEVLLVDLDRLYRGE
ncbi:AAA family ATPase [Streptomyces marianii]|uniref:ArsR family transcriptional regulator n=1 Tax=Streptomyces marianii TaxID=1817406 RepID=A0A5R9EFF0_9ACTN|nr:ArsR family transcriptional regulator [Streptomyces marianii]TLQ47519.1 ArsR family transcriptional regulator [Streptomyces marianii]